MRAAPAAGARGALQPAGGDRALMAGAARAAGGAVRWSHCPPLPPPPSFQPPPRPPPRQCLQWALLSAAALAGFVVFWTCVRLAGFLWRHFLRSSWQ